MATEVKISTRDASYFEHFGTFYAPYGLYEVKDGKLWYGAIDMTALARGYCNLTKKQFPILHQDESKRYGPQIQDLVIGYLDLDMPIMAKLIANWGRYHDAPDDDTMSCRRALVARVDQSINVASLSYNAGSQFLLDQLKKWLEDGMTTDAHVLFHDALNHGLWTEEDREEAELLVAGQHTYTCFQSLPFPSFYKEPPK